VLAEDPDRRLPIIRGSESNEHLAHEGAYLRVGLGQDDLPDAEVVHEAEPPLDHVDHVDRLGVLPEPADVPERLLDGPVGADGHVVRRHEPPNALLGVAKKPDCGLALLRVEEVQEPLRDLAGELLKERCPVVLGESIE